MRRAEKKEAIIDGEKKTWRERERQRKKKVGLLLLLRRGGERQTYRQTKKSSVYAKEEEAAGKAGLSSPFRIIRRSVVVPSPSHRQFSSLTLTDNNRR